MKEKAQVLKRNNRVLIIALFVMMSFIALYAGHFLLEKTNRNENRIKGVEPPFPITYKHLNTVIHGNPQVINILEVNPSDRRVNIKPVLSFNSVFGFEKLSAIVTRSNAYAATNAGFFYRYGNPAGMVIIDGKILTLPTGKNPIFMLENGKAELKQITTDLWLTQGPDRIKIDSMNSLSPQKGIILYTKEFGSDNRAKSENISVVISDKKVVSIDKYPGTVKIPPDSMVVTLYKPYKFEIQQLPFTVGDRIELAYKPEVGIGMNAYECGSWIVQEGKIVIGDNDPWVGVLTNRDPRTVIGLKADGKVVMLTVDGRQPKYSAGFTGRELAEYVLSEGIINAAMLDGGASTEMIIHGEIVNKPSAGGQERPVGGGIIIQLKDDTALTSK